MSQGTPQGNVPGSQQGLTQVIGPGMPPVPYDPAAAPPQVPQRGDMIAYATASRQPRPGLVTTMGVVSIVVGSLGIIYNGLSAIYAGLFWFLAMAGPGVFAGMAAMASMGLPQAERQAVVQAVSTQQWPMTPRREAVFEAFLHDQGRMVFPIRNAAAGQIAGRGTYTGPLSSTVDYVLVAGGRLDIGDDFVAWYPGATGLLAPETPPLGLTTRERQAAVAELQKVSQRPLSPSALAVFTRELGSPEQMFVQSGSDIQSQVIGALASTSGGDVIHSTNGALFYLPAPNPVLTSQGSGNVGVVTSAPSGATKQPAPPSPTSAQLAASPMSAIAAGLAVLEGLASLGLSIFLLVIGIQVFRSSRRGRRHHLIYAWAKLPLAVIYALAWTWTMTGLVGTMTTAFPTGAPPPPTAEMKLGFMLMFGAGAVISIIYPVALLITLQTRTIKSYYEQIGT